MVRIFVRMAFGTGTEQRSTPRSVPAGLSGLAITRSCFWGMIKAKMFMDTLLRLLIMSSNLHLAIAIIHFTHVKVCNFNGAQACSTTNHFGLWLPGE